VLCGRATWKEGIPVYAKEGVDAFHRWLETEGVENIGNVNERLAHAKAWFDTFGVNSADELAAV
jgi:tagatose 1,6-diphosphate aldolase